ncbi:SWIM-type zinc finger 7 associated protein 1 [Silurus asotus]|uniref:SWIM-type zinc finger 7 associated protein 1 n=1 Tax=Silurus asotus TaxID=30991 RepID=A0AAD5FJL8_SILAS|nr:SWIM-type zinc finger 7 associated protein 1 [Silurus asotus]
MADILSFVFQRFGSQLHAAGDLKLFSPTESSTLVIGDEDINKSLLFLTAVTAASEMGLRVLFFTKNQIQSLPVTVKDLSISLKPESLKKIRFVYPKTLEELLEDVASLHELVLENAPLPSLLIVDGLEQYVCVQDRPQQDCQSTSAHVVALLHDTAAFLKARGEKSQQPSCRVIVSYQPVWEGRGGDVAAPDPIFLVLERYLQVRCNLHKVMVSGEVQNEWLLYLSGPGLKVDGFGNGEKCPGLQWRVVMQPNGALEFRPENAVKEETSQVQPSDCGNKA